MDPKIKRRYIPRLTKVFILFAIVIFFLVIARSALSGFRFMTQTGMTPDLLVRLAFDDGTTLKSSEGRTNVLILGIGGGTHAGADLTDTMMVISLDSAKKTVALISIPRDIWSDTLKDKVNTAYHYGEEKKKGGGLVLANVIVEDVVGLPIHYAIVIDFSGFKNVIDEIGGIDVAVTQAFTDSKYPIDGKEHDTCPDDPTNSCLYEMVHFESGLQHMDGTRALKYVRSRHAEGEEGSDFARSRRQQEVMVALKNKLVHPFQWLTLARVQKLPKVLDDATDMDMNIGETLTIGKRFLSITESQMKKISFETLLVESQDYLYDGRFVLVPQDNWDAIHAYIQGELQ